MTIYLRNKKIIKELNNKLTEIQSNKNKMLKDLHINVKISKAITKKILPENFNIKYLEKFNKKIK